jgi:hypothetical protein
MKDPNFHSEQPKDAVADALTDRNADPAARPQDESLKVHGDKLRAADARQDDVSQDGPPDGTRDEGF